MTQSTRTLTDQVVSHAFEMRRRLFESQFQVELQVVQALFQDGWGVLFAGLSHPNVSILREHVASLGSQGVTPILGSRDPQSGHPSVCWSSPQEAAFVFGTAIHVLDFEPMFDPPTHVVSPVLGALATLIHLPQVQPRSGREVLAAFAAGIQLQADLRRATLGADESARTTSEKKHFPFQKQGFHPPGIVGPMGSALCSALLLGLDENQTRHALGIAASRASGVSANIGTMTKATHCGNAARAGVESALLAQRGFTASMDVLDAPSGWGEVFGGATQGDFDAHQLIEGMKTLRCFQSPGFAFKKWPAHTAMQVAIAAAIPLYDPSRSLPEKILIEAPDYRYCDRPFPKDTDESRFSLQHSVAQAILDGEVSFASYTSDRVFRPQLRALLERIQLRFSSELSTAFPRMEIRVTTSDGRMSSSDRWPGHWKSPMSEQERDQKFLACARELLTDDQAENALVCLGSLQDASTIREWVNGLLRWTTFAPTKKQLPTPLRFEVLEEVGSWDLGSTVLSSE
jgi:aconitate decarboxylase